MDKLTLRLLHQFRGTTVRPTEWGRDHDLALLILKQTLIKSCILKTNVRQHVGVVRSVAHMMSCVATVAC